MLEGYAPVKKEIPLLLTIMELYRQQQYMYDHKVHSAPGWIVSIHQPLIQPIVRGKAKAATEFGAKLDVSIDKRGYARIEHISFSAYNESQYVQEAVDRYYERTGHYPGRLLVDQIYRTRDNRAFCKQYGIRMSGPKLEATQLSSITLSVFVSNLFKMQRRILCAFMGKWGLFPSPAERFVIILA